VSRASAYPLAAGHVKAGATRHAAGLGGAAESPIDAAHENPYHSARAFIGTPGGGGGCELDLLLAMSED
jgi:hypothetical protein